MRSYRKLSFPCCWESMSSVALTCCGRARMFWCVEGGLQSCIPFQPLHRKPPAPKSAGPT